MKLNDSKFKSKRKIVHTHLQKNEGNLWSKKMTLNWWKNLICVTLVHTIYMFLPFEDAIRKQSCSFLNIFHCAKTCYATALLRLCFWFFQFCKWFCICDSKNNPFLIKHDFLVQILTAKVGIPLIRFSLPTLISNLIGKPHQIFAIVFTNSKVAEHMPTSN